MDGKRDWTFLEENPSTSGFAPTSRSIKVIPSNRSFSEYRRARSHNIARSWATPSLPQLIRPLDEPFIWHDRDISLDEVIQDEENSRSIDRFILTEDYVRKEGTPSRESALSSSTSRSASKMFEKKVSDLNKEIGQLETENWTLRNNRHETVKSISELREKLDILLSRQECLTEDLNKTMAELEDQKKIMQTIKKDRDSLRQQLDVYLQKELIEYQKSGCTFYCTTCDSKLFTRSRIVSEVRSLNEGTAYIVKSLECEFTLGPQAIRNFPRLSKLLKVRSLYCDGCLKHIGYKFSSADEIIETKSCQGSGRYWIENKYIELGGNGNHKHQRSLEDGILKIW